MAAVHGEAGIARRVVLHFGIYSVASSLLNEQCGEAKDTLTQVFLQPSGGRLWSPMP